MDPGDITTALASGLLTAAPPLVAWIVAIVLSRIMFNRSEGGRAERWLLIGSCLMLVATLFRIPTVLIVPWLIGGGRSVQSAALITSIYNLAFGIIGTAGIICLVYAFWKKFWVSHGSQQRS
jgi:hypothetical protein